MNCPRCHKEVPNGANICPSCGMNFTQMRIQAANKAQEVRGNNAQRGKAASQANPQALIIAAGLVIVFLVLLILLFRFIFGGDDQQNGGAFTGQQQSTTMPSPSPTFKIFGVDVSTPEPVVTVDPLANLIIQTTPTPAPTIEPQYETLRKGSKGDEVKKLQEALIALGYLDDGGADGDYGNGTVAAVKEFQKDNGLTADGHAGQQTLSTLYRKYGGDINKTTTQTTTTTVTDASTLILDQPG